MDARITKQRLANLLSYDWLKILGAIAAAVAFLAVLFTMISTRPTIAQQYAVYSFDGLSAGTDTTTLADALQREFSYEILTVKTESFTDNSMGSAAFTARRTVLQGNALFVSDYAAGEEATSFQSAGAIGLINAGYLNEQMGLFYELPAFFEDCENYLVRFFGEDWETSPAANEEEIRTCFLERNGKDKRFKTDAQKEAGVALEKGRLESLREDYLYVRENGLDSGILTFVDYVSSGYDTEEGHFSPAYTIGINLGKLPGISNLFYYKDEAGNTTAEKVTLLLFNNGERLKDLKYENVTFLRYLLEHYR